MRTGHRHRCRPLRRRRRRPPAGRGRVSRGGVSPTRRATRCATASPTWRMYRSGSSISAASRTKRSSIERACWNVWAGPSKVNISPLSHAFARLRACFPLGAAVQDQQTVNCPSPDQLLRCAPVETFYRLTYRALRIVGCGGGVRSVPGIVGSVMGRRPNTGARLGSLINQNSHVIWVP